MSASASLTKAVSRGSSASSGMTHRRYLECIPACLPHQRRHLVVVGTLGRDRQGQQQEEQEEQEAMRISHIGMLLKFGVHFEVLVVAHHQAVDFLLSDKVEVTHDVVLHSRGGQRELETVLVVVAPMGVGMEVSGDKRVADTHRVDDRIDVIDACMV